MRQRNVNLWLSLIFLIFSVIVYITAIGYDPMPSKFPKLLAIICAILALFLMAGALVKTKREDDTVAEHNGSYSMMLLVCVSMVGYAAMLKFAGYIPSSIVMMIAVGWFLGFRKFRFLLVISIITVLIVYGVFGLLLGVPLPIPFFIE